jgi:hypothetical protein
MVSIGKMIGVDVPRMETILNLAQFLTGEDFASTDAPPNVWALPA